MQVLDIILQIQAEKKGKRHPEHATVREVTDIYPEAKAEIDELERTGVIRLGPTIHGHYIEVINN